jgi:hypothetical protein
MLARNLLALAAKVDLAQAEIARQLGVSQKLANFWAQGLREVSEKHREALVQLVSRAIDTRLRRLGRNTPTGMTFSREVLALVALCRSENLTARGLKPDVAAETVVGELQSALRSAGLQPSDRRWRELVERLTGDLHVIAQVDRQLAEFYRLQEGGGGDTG